MDVLADSVLSAQGLFFRAVQDSLGGRHEHQRLG